MVQAVGAWVVCFRKPREKADLVRQSLPSIGPVGGADGHATWVGQNTEPTSFNPSGGEQSYQLWLWFKPTSAAGSGHAADRKS